MDVFVIPVGADRYELYCEQATDVDPQSEAGASPGVVARLQRRFGQLLREVEAHEHVTATAEAPKSVAARMQDRLLSWGAERIAEQRLLWNLRMQTAVVAVHPEDVSFDEVLVHIRRGLQRDYERHRFWFVIDAVGLTLMGVLAPLPGPNLLAYYFLFRVGGHYLSMRGAAQGRHRVTWSGRACQPLDDLRHVWDLEVAARQARVLAVAAELRLRKLPTFVDRVVRPKSGAREPETE